METKERPTAGRIAWIDTARGLSMLAILLFHTEMYYAGHDVIGYNLYVCNALMAFFFVSGYLFRRGGGIDIRHKIRSILRCIIMPYFIFTTAMALPKAIVHSSSTSFTDIFLNIILGQASWFVTALAVAEIIFTLLIYGAERYRKPLIVPLFCLSGLLAAFLCENECLYIWNTNVALMALSYLYLGYLWHRHDARMSRYVNAKTAVPLFALLIMIKWYVHSNGTSMLVYPLQISSFPLFLADTVTSTALLMTLAKLLPAMRFVTFVGRNSIVYYFLCGGVPLLTAAILNRVGVIYDGNYLKIVLAFTIVCTLTTAVTWLIMRYVPFVTGRKNTT